jgi:hypothetical protein
MQNIAVLEVASVVATAVFGMIGVATDYKSGILQKYWQEYCGGREVW